MSYSGLNHFQIVLDNYDAAAVLNQSLKRVQQFRNVIEVKSRRFVETEQRARARLLRQVSRQFYALRFAAR